LQPPATKLDPVVLREDPSLEHALILVYVEAAA